MPNISSKVESKQMENKQYHDWHAKDREFNVGDLMLVYCYINKQNEWIPGTMKSHYGPVSYIITLETGETVKKHINHRCPQFNLPSF